MSAVRWTPVPGEKVAVLRSHDYGRSRSVAYATVDRVGKRDIVLDDGRRFRVSDLEEQGNGGTWVSSRSSLIEVDAPVVAVVEREQAHRRLLQDAQTACENFCYGREGVTAADTILALAPLTGIASEIEALFGGAS